MINFVEEYFIDVESIKVFDDG